MCAMTLSLLHRLLLRVCVCGCASGKQPIACNALSWEAVHGNCAKTSSVVAI